MRHRHIFWPIILIILGVLLLLDNLGVLAPLGVNVWAIFWPLLLIALGLWVLWTSTGRRARRSDESEQTAVPLDGAARARIRVQHGAGRLYMSAGAAPGNLIEGTFNGGLDYQRRQAGDTAELDLKPRFREWAIPGITRNILDWDLRLTDALPLELHLELGASDTHLDLSALRVVDLKLETGASSTELTLPAVAGATRAKIESGAASVNVRIPAGVAARIRTEGALADVHVDSVRFPRQGEVYQSADYDTAPHRVELVISAAVGAVDVR